MSWGGKKNPSCKYKDLRKKLKQLEQKEKKGWREITEPGHKSLTDDI